MEDNNSDQKKDLSPPFSPLESGEEEGWEPVTSLRNVRELVANQTPRPAPKASSAQELEDYDPYQEAADRFGLTRQEAKDSSTI